MVGDGDDRESKRPRTKSVVSGGQKRMARMTDVARLAGVTAMTVSRALRDPEKVSAKTRQRVEEAVRRSGFVPNYAARSLVSQRSHMIVSLFPTMMNSVFSGAIGGLSETLASNGYQLLLGETNFDIKVEEALLSGFIGWRPAGIIFTGSEHMVATRAILANADVPVIELWNLSKKPFDVAIGFSNYDATYQMTRSLHEWGYRRIAFMYLNASHNDRSVDRRDGYRAAVTKLGLPRHAGLEIQVPFGIRAGSKGLRELLRTQPDIDVVQCASDTLAVGALMEALRMGIRVPQDLAISGFGDVELAAELVPSLTTVRLPGVKIGQTAAETLLQRIEGTYKGPSIIDCGFSIVRRESA